MRQRKSNIITYMWNLKKRYKGFTYKIEIDPQT